VAPHTRLDHQNGAEWRTAVRFVTHHHPGALAAAIQPLAEFSVNMTSLQSRPIPGRPWNYQFYADLEGHPLNGRMGEGLRALEAAVAELSYLGCYPACERP
jgi:chorismate mutase/prephenate dehydratase